MGIIKLLIRKQIEDSFDLERAVDNELCRVAEATGLSVEYLRFLDPMTETNQSPESWYYYNPDIKTIRELENYFGFELWDKYFACPSTRFSTRQGSNPGC